MSWTLIIALFVVLTVVYIPGAHSPALAGTPTTTLASGTPLRSHPESPTCTGVDAIQVQGVCFGMENNQQPAFMAWTNQSNYTFGFYFGYLVEVNSAGSVVAFGNLLTPGLETVTVVTVGDETNFTVQFADGVSNASGLWAPGDIRYQLPTEIEPGSTNLGNVNVTVVFHLWNVADNYSRIKFDFSVSGWPWVDTTDSLGLMVGSNAPTGATIQFDPATANLTEFSPSGTPFASIVFGPNATASSGSTEGPVQVSSSAGIYPQPTPAGEASTYILSNFTGGPAGYSSLRYDPWVIFSNPGGSVGHGTSPPKVVIPPQVAPGSPDYALLVGATLAGGLVLLALTAIAVRSRRTPPEDQLASAPTWA